MANTPPDRDADGDLSCPECYGEVWDNRKKKADGTFSAKSPDFACKDKDNCDWAYWLTPPKGGSGGGRKKKKPARSGKPSRNGGSPPPPPSGGPLSVALYNAFQLAVKVDAKLREDQIELMDSAIMIPDLAKAMFEAHVASGRPFAAPSSPAAKKKKKKKKPPPPPVEEDEEEAEGEYEYVPDDELPF